MRTLFFLLTFLSFETFALEIVPYSDKAVSEASSKEAPYAIEFFAEWCLICQQQKFMIGELNKNDKFDKMTVFVADFDFEKALKIKYKVERQSTVILFRSGEEIDRTLGLKDKDKLAEQFAKGL